MLLTAVLVATGVPKPTPPKPLDMPTLVAERERWCREYRAASTEKGKSSVFAKYVKATEQLRATIDGLDATVTSVETSSDGRRVVLTVRAPVGNFSNDDVWRLDSAYHVERGSTVFETIAALSDSDAVLVWLANVKPWHSDLQPAASICGTRWFAQYVKVVKLATE